MSRPLPILLAIAVLAAPGFARAQNATAVVDAPDLNAELVDGLCNGELPDDVTVTLTSNETKTPDVFEGDDFYAWWVASESDCSKVATGTGDQEYSDADIDAALTAELNSTAVYPDDFGVDLELTTETILSRAGGACDVADGKQKLCFGVDAQTSANETIDAGEWLAWVIFDIDTTPPGNGIIVDWVPKDGKVEVDVRMVDSGESDDLTAVKARWRPAKDADGETDCKKWSSYEEREIEAAYRDLGANTQTIEITVENSVPYQLCVWGVDDLGNEGGASSIEEIEAQEECDFIECYPGNPPHGYCGAAGYLPAWASLVGVAWVFRRRRRS